MDASLLTSLFGADGRWCGPCTVIVNADAHVQTIGSDAIVQGGVKAFSPRLITGRIPADNVAMMPGQRVLVLYRRVVQRQGSAEDRVQTTVHVIDTANVAAVEFDGVESLAKLGLKVPEREVPSRCEPNYTTTR
jgi:hypothetical protein